MRLGAPLFETVSDPEIWVAAVRRRGYRAAYCPVSADTDADTVQAYVTAAHRADIVIAEVGAWSNPISPDATERAAAIARCKTQLVLADHLGARCCVNIAGSRGTQWDGPHEDNFLPATFDQIVETVREILDAVSPIRTYYALETMPWAYPDSPESYLRLIAAIDRPRFAVHLDPANMINCPQRFFDNAGFIRECFAKLGPYIKTCHAKDIALTGRMTVHLDEVRPGLGRLDYSVFLQEASRLDPDLPIMLEHLPTEEEYDLAAVYVRGVAADAGLAL